MTIKSMTTNHWGQSRERRKGHTLTGVVIATVGFFWLAKKIGWIPAAAGVSAIFWPAVTIAAGIAIFLPTRRHRKSDGSGNLPTNTKNFGQRCKHD